MSGKFCLRNNDLKYSLIFTEVSPAFCALFLSVHSDFGGSYFTNIPKSEGRFIPIKVSWSTERGVLRLSECLKVTASGSLSLFFFFGKSWRLMKGLNPFLPSTLPPLINQVSIPDKHSRPARVKPRSVDQPYRFSVEGTNHYAVLLVHSRHECACMCENMLTFLPRTFSGKPMLVGGTFTTLAHLIFSSRVCLSSWI